MANAVSYLETQLSTVSNDTYALSIVTYALTVVGSKQAATALQALSNLAITQGMIAFLLGYNRLLFFCRFPIPIIWTPIFANNDLGPINRIIIIIASL